MKPIKPWVKYTAAMLLLVGGVGGSVLYNQFWQPMMNSQTVYLATNSLPAGTPITSNDWREVSMKKTHVSPGAITDWETLNGLYTAQAMSANQQFTALDTENNPYTITPGTEDVPIAQSWIVSVSPTLRQGDYVKIVPIAGQGSVPFSGNAVGLSLDHLLVLSVHTTQNMEVMNASPNGPQTVGARDNGLGTPSIIDLKMTALQASELKMYVQEKYQLMIVGVTAPHLNTASSTTTSTTSPASSTTINTSNGMYP